jgi:hypothetical protein
MSARQLVWVIGFFLVGVSSSAHAQAPGEKFTPCVIGVGVQTGVCMSDLRVEAETMHQRTSPMFGAFVVFGYAPYLGLQGEVSYLSRGSEEIRLDYLQFALLGRLGGITMPRDPQAAVIPRIFGGFGVSHLLSDHGASAETSDVSLIFGAGADIRFGPRRRITIDYRYDYGLRDVFSGATNRASLLMLGVSF